MSAYALRAKPTYGHCCYLTLLMRFVPVLAYSHFGRQRHLQFGHARHQFRQLALDQFQLRVRHFQHQFIVAPHD